ncbi:MAG TPA: IPT/TIG domain-containing protein [Opitutaceae bacterium]|jgi:hypothetical protein|nr:IPT/TIG domain-containing protein [Opitutaceae bacterium]HXA14101.1 IPT/TIG domain-containing protein [Opitutaceae bacterium]
MHKNPFAHARKFLTWLGAAFGLVLLAGCDLKIVNLTPSTLPENPSQIYTVSARLAATGGNIVDGSVVVHLIVDNQDLIMKKSSLGNDIYELDYQLPPGRDEFIYYILVNYKVDSNGMASDRESYIEPVHVKIASRYVLSLEANRGPVGAQIGLLGRGFTPQDVVYFDSTPARTVYASPTALNFFVPAVDPDHSYKVAINNADGSSPVGTFHVDALNIQASPASLTLHSGEQQSLTFTLPVVAPAGGLLLDVTTDVPDSIIMPEVIVPAGGTSVTVTVQGGHPGTGSLVLKGYGAGSLTIPVTVQ